MRRSLPVTASSPCSCAMDRHCAASPATGPDSTFSCRTSTACCTRSPSLRVSGITEEKHSLMQPASASGDELQNLIAYLSGLTGVRTGDPALSHSPDEGGIDFARILNP